MKGLVDGFLFTFEYPYKSIPTSTLSAAEIADAKRVIVSLSDEITVLNPVSRLRSVTGTQPCHDWLAVSVDHTGILKHGCFVQQLEPRRCEVCELGCFQLISSFLEFELSAWLNFSSLLLRRANSDIAARDIEANFTLSPPNSTQKLARPGSGPAAEPPGAAPA
jgi:hypothetical protein